MIKIKYLFLIAFIGVLISCTKEMSLETKANLLGLADGTLKDSLGDCKGIVVNGKYIADSTLTPDHFILVNVTITTAGNYKIASDTVNGFWFKDSGYTALGNQTIKVRGYGKPILPLNSNFTVFFNNSNCSFTVSFNTAVVNTLLRDYFPTTVGSNWCYDLDGFADTLNVTASADNRTFAGNSYRVFYSYVDPTDKDTTYFRKSGNNYFTYDFVDEEPTPSDLMMLKDDQPIFHNWMSPVVTQSIGGLPVETRTIYTLMSVHQPRSVNGFNFDSVIHVKHDTQIKLVGAFVTVRTHNIYYAKNVGLIEIDIPGQFFQKIRRWSIR